VPVLELCVMRLRAFVSDKFDGFIKNMMSIVVLSDRDLEKRERLVQTYLIIFGLFLSYNRDLAL